MKSADIDRISDWIIRRGLECAQETDLLIKFCEKCKAAGLPLTRALVVIDTLHPVHEGTVFRWSDDNVEENAATQYGRTNEGEAAASWQRSPFYHLLQSGGEELRRRIAWRADRLAADANLLWPQRHRDRHAFGAGDAVPG